MAGHKWNRSAPFRCYRGDEDLGVDMPAKWAAKLGIDVTNIYGSKNGGYATKGPDGKKYKFVAATDPELPVSLEGVNAVAKAEGKTYADLQKEETMAARVIKRVEVLEAANKKKEQVMEMQHKEEEPVVLPADPGIRLRDFARMADETTLLIWKDEQWVMTAPSESPVFEATDWVIDSFRAEYMDGAACLKVWVR